MVLVSLRTLRRVLVLRIRVIAKNPLRLLNVDAQLARLDWMMDIEAYDCTRAAVQLPWLVGR